MKTKPTIYLQIKFGSTTYKTEVYRKSLNPQWNTEWYRFEVSMRYEYTNSQLQRADFFAPQSLTVGF